MLIRESELLGLEPGGLLREKILSFSSTPGGADTPARITGDGYKNGGGSEEYPTTFRDECRPIGQG